MHTDLTQGSISKHLRQLAIPAAIGFFFHTMFNVTDTYFAGKISTDALAALSLTFPIFFIIISVGAGMSEAVTTLIGNTLGAKNYLHAKQIVWHAFFIALFLSLVLSATGLIISPYLLQYLGAEGNYLSVSLDYILTLLWASIFFTLSYFLNAMLTAIGDLRSFRNILIIAFFINIILDYWFVYGGLGLKPLGVSGVAIATVLTEIIGMLYLAYKLKQTLLLRAMPDFNYDKKIIIELIKQGIPPTVNLLLMAGGIFIITFFASHYGKDVIAGMGIGMRVEQIVLMPSLGISISVLAVVSQNNGAKAFKRIDETLKVAVKDALLLSALGMYILIFHAHFFVSLFTVDETVIAQGVIYTQIAAWALFAYVLIFTFLSLLQGIQKPAALLYISISRQIILPLIIFTLLSYYSLEVHTLWWAINSIVWASALFVVWYAKRSLKKERRKQSQN